MKINFLITTVLVFASFTAANSALARNSAQCKIDNSCKGIFDGDFLQVCNIACEKDPEGYGKNPGRDARLAREANERLERERKLERERIEREIKDKELMERARREEERRELKRKLHELNEKR
jgi:hypothetical protein